MAEAPRAPDRRPADQASIAGAAALLRHGEVVAYPTETLYGLGVDGLSAEAVDRLVAIKGRDSRQPISLLVADEEMLADVVHPLTPAALALARAHWPGPLTLVLRARQGLPSPLLNERGGVGVRISPDPVAAALVRALGRPLTATSANRSGEPAAEEASAAALTGVSLILDDGPRRGAPSTVVDAMGEALRVLRRGAIAL